MITAIGALLLPLCLRYWRRPGPLLQLVVVYSAFSAAAILVIGGNGVTPALVPAALFIGMFMLNAGNGVRYPAERPVLMLLAPFILTVCGALLSSLIMPRLFAGDVLVWPQKGSVLMIRSPLAPNAGNFTQDMYLAVNALLAITAALYLTRPGALLRRLLDVYFWSALIVVFIALWQFAGNMLHVWFPTDFFLSNPNWSQLSDQSIGSLIRLNGPFSEPSSLAAYLCAPTCAAGWIVINGERARLPRFVFWCGLAIVLLSTSSTGYVTLAGMVALLLLRTVLTGSPRLRQRVFGAVCGFALVVGIAYVAVPRIAPGVAQETSLIVSGTLNKQQSDSYRMRSLADHDSLDEMFETYGLGVGWGSNRSSSLGPGLLAAVGLWGVLGFAWFGLALAFYARKALREATDPQLRLVIRGVSVALLSYLISALLSGPTISSPDFYLLLAMLIGACARVRHEAAGAAPARARHSLPVRNFQGAAP